MRVFLFLFGLLVCLSFSSMANIQQMVASCEIDEGLGLSTIVNGRDFSIENQNECFMIIQKTLYELFKEGGVKKGLIIPLTYTDISGKKTKCIAEFLSDDFITDKDFITYLANENLNNKNQTQINRLYIDFLIEKNKEGLDLSIPVTCEFIGA